MGADEHAPTAAPALSEGWRHNEVSRRAHTRRVGNGGGEVSGVAPAKWRGACPLAP